MSTVLVVNAGSSSLKYALVGAHTGEQELAGVIERIGADVPDHAAAFALVRDEFANHAAPVPAAIGHRVVHGGSHFAAPVEITAAVQEAIAACIPLAPLHNPAALVGIAAAEAVFPDVPQVAVFDTAFHQTMPLAAATYAIDRDVAAQFQLRRYGFHGTSHAYVAGEVARYLDRPLTELKIISLHLGNGASACAIDGGRSVDTSMGVTPVEGLVMGTRGGDMDPAIPVILARAGWDADQVDDFLNHQCGLKGLTGSSDLRDVTAQADAGDDAAELARQVMAHRLRGYIGAYAAVLGGVDVVVFTAGIGEHAPWIRAAACAGLEFMGITVSPERNAAAIGPETPQRINEPQSRVQVVVVPTDEELAIAQQTTELLQL
ncbi:MAG: acetate kinase [Actinomycetia bacterium]|nr:acetate kinase [Actinomycetes bacterium]